MVIRLLGTSAKPSPPPLWRPRFAIIFHEEQGTLSNKFLTGTNMSSRRRNGSRVGTGTVASLTVDRFFQLL